ncbi:hypothetical protein ACIOD1_15170 [Streptomyces sp. NPDC088097]|uniref:hypothetical protein n=1 Tax=Streptomyces sp. NPDC088097 TaxID=3365823 RepID=UPI003822168F
METPTTLVIGQLAEYVRELTRRLDPSAGWYGEFLRRDPEGMRACADGVAMPPWDVLESLLGDLPGEPDAVARESAYAAGLRAAAVAVWDTLPGGAGELRALLAAAEEQRAATREALRTLSARLDRTEDPVGAAALTRELAWSRDDEARAAARYADLVARSQALAALTVGSAPRTPDPTGRPHGEPAAGPYGEPAPGPYTDPAPGPWPLADASAGPGRSEPGPASEGAPPPQAPPAPQSPAEPLPAVPRQREGRWLRGARRTGGARYAGAPAAEAPIPAPAPALPAPRGARFGHLDPGPAAEVAPAPAPAEVAPAEPPAPARPDLVGHLLALRAQGRTGEAHVLLCEAAAGPASRLPGLAVELGRAGLAADWATLLWEAASLPPGGLAAAAAALGDAGRDADCERLLRQGVARPAAEVAEAALVLGGAGRDHEALLLLGAFVGLRTAEEAAALARHEPQWFAPRLLHAARSLPGTRYRDLTHALRVAGLPVDA